MLTGAAGQYILYINNIYSMEAKGSAMNLIISNETQIPIYEQIKNQLQNLIIEGELEAGQVLPSIRALAKELGISVITTKRAYEELEREGLIVTVGGKGTFVAVQNLESLKAKRRLAAEKQLAAAVSACKGWGFGLEELQEMLQQFYREVEE